MLAGWIMLSRPEGLNTSTVSESYVNIKEKVLTFSPPPQTTSQVAHLARNIKPAQGQISGGDQELNEVL